MSWFNQLKSAIVIQDTKAIERLTKKMPKFETLKEMQEASYLLKEAQKLMIQLKDETLAQMNQIKKNIKFIESTAPKQKNSLDINS
ncbi:MAG: hypothetical protein GXO11_01370 [Epsilonproteobacteria bacterium]|nr:hypothetical protein [Campylobacterota bacterium]